MQKLILASASPRRIEMLQQYNIAIEVKPASIKEFFNESDPPEKIAMDLAYQKALSIALVREELVLGADTIVVVDNKILGKPQDENEAYDILETLSGREHRVITGISLIKGQKKIIDYETTFVKFRKLKKRQILEYIATSEPMDKAGAYGIQGYGRILVEKINGSYSNVVGLPLVKVDLLLKKHFGLQLF